MPELPEVETVVRDLRSAGLPGRKIVGGRVLWAGAVACPSAAAFRRRIRGRVIRGVRRRGKYLLLELSAGWTLLIHLRMTGRLLLTPASAPRLRPERLVLVLDDGRELRLADSRKFGRVWLTRHPAEILAGLGPEALAVTRPAFLSALKARARQLKPLLLDQAFLAGIGNIYADEALWSARLHPRRTASSLTDAEASQLWRAIRLVLRRGLRNLGTTLGGGQTHFVRPRGGRGRNQERLRAYGRTGCPCDRCGILIRRLRVGQRSTHVCPRCQPEPGREAPGRTRSRRRALAPAGFSGVRGRGRS